MTEEERIEQAKQFESQLKGVIPRKLSVEEAGELIEWLKENKKNVPYFLVKEHRKRIREISKPPDTQKRKRLQSTTPQQPR
jgi:NTP pyrophosphatase (non-canonical NTP hydrolase)